MPALHSNMVPLGTIAHNFELQGTDDKTYSLSSFLDKDVIVIIFMCNHCPYVKAVINRLIDLQNEFVDRGVQLIGINPNDSKQYLDDSLDNMKKIAKEKGFSFPYLIDPSQKTAKEYDAISFETYGLMGTPSSLLIDKKGVLRYKLFGAGQELDQKIESLLGE